MLAPSRWRPSIDGGKKPRQDPCCVASSFVVYPNPRLGHGVGLLCELNVSKFTCKRLRSWRTTSDRTCNPRT